MIQQPQSRLEEHLFLSSAFDPLNRGCYLVPDTIAGNVVASIEEIEEALRKFEHDGLVAPVSLEGVPGSAYTVIEKGWTAREHFLRHRGLRSAALTHQQDYALSDLIVGLVMAPHVWNGRTDGLGAEPRLTIGELATFLGEYTAAAIVAACANLVGDGLLKSTTKLGSGEAAYEVTGLGRQRYETEVAGRLRLPANESVLDIRTRKYIEVFNAWQSECTRSRNLIWEVLPQVIDELNALDGLPYPLKEVRASEAGDGALRIDVALQEKIRRADFFVGDLTPVYAYDDRLRVNENVLVEVGFALASKKPEQIILLARKRNDVPGDATRARPTFDIANVRRVEFETKSQLRSRLRAELDAALRNRGWLKSE